VFLIHLDVFIILREPIIDAASRNSSDTVQIQLRARDGNAATWRLDGDAKDEFVIIQINGQDVDGDSLQAGHVVQHHHQWETTTTPRKSGIQRPRAKLKSIVPFIENALGIADVDANNAENRFSLPKKSREGESLRLLLGRRHS